MAGLAMPGTDPGMALSLALKQLLCPHSWSTAGCPM